MYKIIKLILQFISIGIMISVIFFSYQRMNQPSAGGSLQEQMKSISGLSMLQQGKTPKKEVEFKAVKPLNFIHHADPESNGGKDYIEWSE